MKKLLAACAAIALLAGCSSSALIGMGPVASPVAAAARETAGVPTYRFVHGVRRATLSASTFAHDLTTRWLPAVNALQGSGALVSYVSAMPPSGMADFPDAIALAAYESPEAYDRARASAAGKTLQALEAALFDRDRTVESVPVAWSASTALEPAVAYDVMGRPTEWHGGVTTFFIGRRQEAVPAAEFLSRLTGQVRRERQAFEGQGLTGYVFWASADYKVSFMHWTDLAAFGRAMQSPQGQAVVADSQALMQTVQFVRAAQGPIAPGQAVTLSLAP
ncbi:MAG TPA: hypothetical protein V6D05_03670 [Stenomitos sp.]